MATSIIKDHHLFTRNLKLNGNYISNDSGNEGLIINDFGETIFKSSIGLLLDGTNDYLDFGDVNLINTSDYSISLWFKTAVDDANGTIINKYQADGAIGWKLEIDGASYGGKVLFEHKTGSGDYGIILSDAVLADDSWHHVVITADRTGSDGLLKMYIDGSVQADTHDIDTVALQATINPTAGSGFGELIIGSSSRNFLGDFNGSIDEVAIFNNRILSSGNVTTIYNSGVPKDLSAESGLVGYWRFDEGTGTAADSSTNSNGGTLVNNATYGIGAGGTAVTKFEVNSNVVNTHKNIAFNGNNVTDAGKIGIGTSAPTDLLHTSKSTTGTHWMLTRDGENKGYIGADSTGLLLAGDSGITDATILVNNDQLDLDFVVSGDSGEIFRTDGANNYLKLSGSIVLNDNYISNDGGAEGIRIDNDGKVGIGKAVPGAVVDILSAWASPAIRLSSSLSDDTEKLARITLQHYDIDEPDLTIMYASSHNTSYNEIFIGGAVGGNNTAQNIRFYTDASATAAPDGGGTERLRIASGGNVGIGAIDPGSLLEVRGPTTDNATGCTGILTLSTALTDVNALDQLGRINFQAPKEAGGTDAILPGAAIWGEAEATFASGLNSTAVVFGVHTTDNAVERMRLTSAGVLKLSYDADSFATMTVGDSSLTTLATGESGNFILDAAGDIVLDAAGETIYLKFGGSPCGTINMSATALDIKGQTSDTVKLTSQGSGDIHLQSDGGVIKLYKSATYFGKIDMDTSTELIITTAAGKALKLQDSGTVASHIEMGKAAGFTKIAEAFSDDSVIGSGGTDDTHIDFRESNKISLAVTGDITNLNLIFPAITGNFLLLLTYDGDHDITNWKVYESDASAADGDTDVLWPGGTAPATTDSGVDIFSFFYDATAGADKCYGVGSLNFSN